MGHQGRRKAGRGGGGGRKRKGEREVWIGKRKGQQGKEPEKQGRGKTSWRELGKEKRRGEERRGEERRGEERRGEERRGEERRGEETEEKRGGRGR